MNLSQISLALVALSASAPSFAITASNYTNSSEFAGDTLNIRISGSATPNNGILALALSRCVAGTVHRYGISDNVVYFCAPNIGTGAGQITVPAGKTKLAIYKYSVGGSISGVIPLNNGELLPFLDLSKLSVLCNGIFATTTAPASFSPTLSTYVDVACSNASSTVTALAKAYIGLSDVDPSLLTNNTSNLTTTNTYASIPGVFVSRNVHDALQGNIFGRSAASCVGLDTEACMPSLSSAQITSAFTQVGQTWGGIGVNFNPTGDDTIYVARGVDSSGTQKTFEALIARTPNGQPSNKNCAVGVEPFVAPDSAPIGNTVGDNEVVCGSATPPLVFGGLGSRNVRNCVAAHSANNRGAIGVLTTEDKPGTADWRFVKIDGVAPTQANVAKGTYRHYVEASLNIRTAGAFATSAALGYTAFVNTLKADLTNLAIIKLINGANQTFGAAGLMALLPAGGTPDYTGASSVIPWTKLVGGSSLNGCQAPKASF